MTSFKGRVVAITGGASGIGLATAKILASRGATVSLADVNQTGLENAIKAVSTLGGGKHSATVVDVGDSKAVAAWIQQTVSDHGRLDSAVNLAGMIRVNHPLKDETDEAWARTMHINADGVFYCLRAELNVMKDGGSIVSASSVAGHLGMAGLGAYCASKAAVELLTKTAAREHPNLRINAVSPGATATPMVAVMEAEMGHTQPTVAACINRQADPSEIAQSIVFLLSDDASYITGTIMDVDGGWMA